MTQLIWPLRALLFIPAHKLDWVRKVHRWSPDAVILDLEDAVPPGQKATARAAARDAVAILREAGIPAFVRINSLQTGGADDVQAVAIAGLTGIFVPKVQSAADIREVDTVMSYAEGANGLPLASLAIIAIPETTTGLRLVYEIACASRRVRGAVGLMSGPVSGDFARAVGLHPTDAGFEQMYFASKTIIDCRAAGAAYPLAALVGTVLDDLAAVRVLAERARAFGFTGATVIHPAHVAVVRDVFSPSESEIAEAVGLLTAMRDAEATGSGAVAYRGRMVDYAMLARAEEVLQQARRYGLPVPEATA